LDVKLGRKSGKRMLKLESYRMGGGEYSVGGREERS
jgi:hypothetical protein